MDDITDIAQSSLYLFEDGIDQIKFAFDRVDQLVELQVGLVDDCVFELHAHLNLNVDALVFGRFAPALLQVLDELFYMSCQFYLLHIQLLLLILNLSKIFIHIQIIQIQVYQRNHFTNELVYGARLLVEVTERCLLQSHAHKIVRLVEQRAANFLFLHVAMLGEPVECVLMENEIAVWILIVFFILIVFLVLIEQNGILVLEQQAPNLERFQLCGDPLGV